jgi:hypothetical protein
VTCTDHDSKTALCTIPAQSAPPSCTADGAAYSGVDDGHLANGNGVTCAALEAPFSQDGGALGASCVSSTDCALVCCGCAKPSWIFATALCVQGQCAAPALACSWGYAKDPLVCGPAM